VRFWDSSAILAVLGSEDRGRDLAAALEEDPAGLIWLLTPVEVRSGLARGVRSGAIDAAEREFLWEDFDRIRRAFLEVDAILKVRQAAQRLLDTHPLRSGDALQLAAAIVGAEGHPETLPFVTLDLRLAEAAAREGFLVLPPPSGEGIVAEARARIVRRKGRRSPLAATATRR
jgi:uncharacterized protein